MAGAFQTNAFQNNAFQVDAVVPAVVASHPATGGSVLARGGGRRRAGSGSWVRLDDELTPAQRLARDAELDRRLAEEERERQAEIAARAEAHRLANLRHLSLTATGTEIHLTKHRAKLLTHRGLAASGRWVVHAVARFIAGRQDFLLPAAGASIAFAAGQAELTQRDAVQSLRVAQDKLAADMAAMARALKRAKDDADAMQLLLLST
jgi:hypothetical protein